MIEFIHTTLPDVILIKPQINGDSRGFFFESYKESVFRANGILESFVQDNHSKSSYGVLRGLHYQVHPYEQGKLVRCVSGAIFDVAVDIRKNSPTFAKWMGCELSADNKHMLYIPPGFAHGFLTLSPDAEVLYKTTNEYNKESDRGVLFNDPEIGIEWPKLDIEPILSDKDIRQPLLRDGKENE